jgi:hypothetical protein
MRGAAWSSRSTTRRRHGLRTALLHHAHRARHPPRRRRRRRVDRQPDRARHARIASGHAARHVPRIPARRVRRHRVRTREPAQAPRHAGLLDPRASRHPALSAPSRPMRPPGEATSRACRIARRPSLPGETPARQRTPGKVPRQQGRAQCRHARLRGTARRDAGLGIDDGIPNARGWDYAGHRGECWAAGGMRAGAKGAVIRRGQGEGQLRHVLVAVTSGQ